MRLYEGWRSSASWRVRWALALKKLSYESVLVDIDRKEHFDDLAGGQWSYQSDKAWDAIHRCLTDGRTLDAGEDYTACLVEVRQVRELAAALEGISKVWLRERFDALDGDYHGSQDDD